MQFDNSDKSLQEWPTLNDVVNRNLADGRLVQNGQSTSSDNGMDNATRGASVTENGRSHVNNTRAGKKNSSKRNNWTRLPINPPPYRQRGGARRYDSTRPFEDDQSNQNGNNYSNGYLNGRGNSRSRGIRGNRGRGFSNFRQRREMTTFDSVNPVQTEVTGHCSSGTVFYSPAPQRNLSIETLKQQIKRQIEYYFSEENLSSDEFMRKKMDKQGFLPLSLIATFNRLKILTDDMDAIVEAVKESSKLEFHENNLVRPVVDPLRWPMPYTSPALRTDVPEFFPGQPYVNVEPVIEQFSNLHVNGVIYPQLSTPMNLHYPPISIENANDFSVLEATKNSVESNGVNHHIEGPADVGAKTNSVEQDFNGLDHYTDNPADLGVSSVGQDFNGLDQYVDDQIITNGYNYSNDSSPVQQISGFEYFPQPISNGVMFYNNELSSKQGCYSVLNPDEKLSNGIDNPDDQGQMLHNKSPEPTSLTKKIIYQGLQGFKKIS